MMFKAAIRIAWLSCLALAVAACSMVAKAQDLEPRAYSPAPVGTNFVLASYTYITGDVLLDPSLPIQNVSVQFNGAALGYYHCFGVFGRQTTITFGIPYVWGAGDGLVNGVFTHIYRSGLGDPVLRISYNLYGSPALSPQEFAKRKARTIIGASVLINAPLGQYNHNLLVNIGTNRWSFRPQVGFSREVHSWDFDLYLGGYFFTANAKFFGEHVRTQAPIGAAQVHVSYTIRRGMWVAVDGIYYTGGRTTVDGVLNEDLQQSVRVGLTYALPIRPTQSLKFQFTRGAVTRIGGDYTTLSIAYQYRFMTRR